MAEFLQSATKVATDVSKVVGQVAGGLHSIGLLDPPVEMLEMPATDRISATVAPNVTLVGQAQVLPTEIGELDHTIRDTATSVVSEVGQLNVQRYVPLASFEWAASTAAKTEIKDYKMPNDIIKSGPAALLSKFFRFYRTKMEVVAQLNPGPGIAGILVGVYVPGGAVFDIATYKNFPHGIINCSVNTSVTIKIPYFWGSPMQEFDVASGLGDLKFFNLTKLSAPTGAPNTLTVSVFARLVEPEFQALRPVSIANAQGKTDPGGEEVMRVKEGIGAMMLNGQEYTVGPRLSLLNEQTRPDDGVVSDTVFTDFKEIYTIPSVLAEFEWAQSAKAGDKLLAKNIRCESSSLTTPEYERTNLAHVARFYVLYQGDITLTFQFAASKLNQGRVLAAFFPNETAEFTYDKVSNAVTTVMDLGLNSSFDMTLPFVNTTPLRATGTVHGQLMLFVQTPLAYNAAAPSTISGVVYIAGAKNMTFHVPNRRPLKYVQAQGRLPSDTRGWRKALLLKAGDVESNPGPDVLPSADKAEVADPVGSIENDGGRKPKGEPTFLNMGSSSQSMIPSHTNITAIAGRAMLVDTFVASASKKFQSFAIKPDSTSAFELFKIFRFRSGDFNLHITHTSIGTVFASHGYFSLSSSANEKLDLSVVMASGAVAIPTGTMMTLKVPYYYIQPFTDITQLGTLYIWPQRASAFNINVFISFDEFSRFAFLQSPPEVSALTTGGRASRSAEEEVQAKTDQTGMLQKVMLKRRRMLQSPVDELEAAEPEGLFPREYRWRVPEPPDPPPLEDPETGEDAAVAQGQTPLASVVPPPEPEEAVTWQTLWMMADRAEGPYPIKEILLASSPGDKHAVKVRYGNATVACTGKSVKEATDMAAAAAYEMAKPTMDEFAVESTLRMPVKPTWLEMIAEIRSTGLWRPRVIAWTVQQAVCVVFEVKENLCHMHGKSKRAVCEQFAADKNRKWQAKGLIDCNDPDVNQMLLMRSGDVEQNPGPLDGLVTWITGLTPQQREVASSLLEGVTRAPEGIERGKAAALQVFKHQAVSVVVRGLCYYVIFSQSPSTSVTACAGILALGDAAHYFMEGLGGFVDAFSTVMAVDSLPDVQQRVKAKKKIGSAIRKCFAQEVARDQGVGLKDVAQILTIGKSCEWLLNLLQKILHYLKNTFFPDAVVEAQGKLEEMEVMILDAITETNELADINRQQGGLRTLDEIRRWAATAHVINQAIRLAVESKSKAHSFLYQARRSLDSCRLAKGVPETAFRMDPACFHITGPPGQGKTLLLERTAHMVAKSLGAEVFYHPTASAHMDGYYGQRVHVWDEIFARRDETDAELILSLASSGHYIPPMADLGDKGMYYRGEVILSASNNDLKSEIALKCNNAIQRRFEQISFRAKAAYLVDKGGVACLDEEMANQDGTLKTGECWEIRNGADWETLNLHDMVERILEKHRKKTRVYLDMLGMVSDDVAALDLKKKSDKTEKRTESKAVDTEDLPMDDKPIGPDPKKSRYRETVAKRWKSLKSNPWSEWLYIARDVITTVGSVIGIGSVLYGLYRASRPLEASAPPAAQPGPEKAKEQAGARAYSGPIPARRMIRVDRRRDTVIPNGGSSFAHLLRNVVRFQWQSGHEQSAVAMGYGRYLTTAHNMGWGTLEIHSSSSRLDLTEEDFEVYTMTADDGGETDVAELVFTKELGFDHRDISKYVAKPEEKKSAKIIVAEAYGYHEKDIHNLKREPVHIFDGELLRGVIHGQFEYEGSTESGDCGGMIIQEQKGTWRIVGIHNGRYVKPVRGLYRCTGYELFRLDLDRCDAQGVVVAKQKCDRVHVASRSGLHPSPFSGAFEMTKAPAALSPYDPRLEESGVSLLKKSCEKFDSDVFMVDDITMNLAMDWMTEDLRSCVPLTGCTNIYEAIRGCGANPLDLTTSPGLKYTKRGKIKRDLFYYDTNGRPIVSADFRDEVIEQYDKLYQTGEIETDFCAYLKDELRPVEKIVKGKTRAILACSVDYTVVYRMVMAEMYAHIYNSPSWQTHIAVGIDPFTEASEMVKELVKYQHHYCLDYSSFDGRLPQKLMRMGVEVLSRLHSDPDMVTALHEPVVGARCVVMDEMWHLKGGMPSGAPCTSVLNTICNVLAINCVMIGAGYERGSFGVVAYGDDCVISVREKRDIDWVGTMKEWFGMVVTPASKAGDVCAVPLEEVEFLKRRLRYVEGSWRATLDIGTIEQALMWMTSRDDFVDKVRSLSLELAQHGSAEFNRVRKACIERSDHHFPTYSEAKRMLDSVCVQNFTHLLGIG